jgi:hypothetical protein
MVTALHLFSVSAVCPIYLQLDRAGLSNCRPSSIPGCPDWFLFDTQPYRTIPGYLTHAFFTRSIHDNPTHPYRPQAEPTLLTAYLLAYPTLTFRLVTVHRCHSNLGSHTYGPITKPAPTLSIVPSPHLPMPVNFPNQVCMIITEYFRKPTGVLTEMTYLIYSFLLLPPWFG